MGLNLDKLLFDPANPSDAQKVGAVLVDGLDQVLTSTLVSGKQALDVNVVSTITVTDDDAFQNDTAFNATDKGSGIVAVRQDTQAGTATADGNYGELVADAVGSLYVRDSAARVSLASIDSKLLDDGLGKLRVNNSANSSIKTSNANVTAVAAQVLVTPLANRSKVVIQNRGGASIFLGKDNTVTASNGLEIPKNASFSEELGDGVALWLISASGTVDVRFLEAA